MGGLIYLILLVAVFCGVGALFYFNVVDTPAPVETATKTVRGFLEQQKCFPDGSCVNLLISDKPENIEDEKVVQEVQIPTVKKNEETGEYEEDVKIVEVKGEDDIPQISKTNPEGVVVQGYVKLMDATTGNPMKPYLYNVLVTISCDEDKNLVEGFNYCSTDSIFGRVETTDAGKDDDGIELGGYFKYVWHPKFTDSTGFYDVEVLVTSDQKNSLGRYENYENTYKIQVIS